MHHLFAADKSFIKAVAKLEEQPAAAAADKHQQKRSKGKKQHQQRPTSERCRSSKEGQARAYWLTSDTEILEVLPGHVRRCFDVVLNAGSAMHKPLFDALCNAVSHGTSFAEFMKGVEQQKRMAYIQAVHEWTDYQLRCSERSFLPGCGPPAKRLATSPDQPAATAGGAHSAAAAASMASAAVAAAAAADGVVAHAGASSDSDAVRYWV